MTRMTIKTLITTVFALLAFAGNSVLCRLALGEGQIDATSFTIIRLMSGALAFVIILALSGRVDINAICTLKQAFKAISQRWLGAMMLLLYATGFSFAYVQLSTGVGALVLFGMVQLTMIGVSIYKQEYLPWLHIVGVFIAFCGLFLLVYSQLVGEDVILSILGLICMLIAGIAWGVYTLLGRGSSAPFLDTGSNFILSAVFCMPLLLIYLLMPAVLSAQGVGLAVVSGVVTSMLGYAIWYVALPNLSRVQAGAVQLMVPVIAAFGGLIWVSEAITLPLLIAQAMVLGGIAMVMIKVKVVPQKN